MRSLVAVTSKDLKDAYSVLRLMTRYYRRGETYKVELPAGESKCPLCVNAEHSDSINVYAQILTYCGPMRRCYACPWVWFRGHDCLYAGFGKVPPWRRAFRTQWWLWHIRLELHQRGENPNAK